MEERGQHRGWVGGLDSVKGVFPLKLPCYSRPGSLLSNPITGHQLRTSVKGVFLFHLGFHRTAAVKLARKGLCTLADGDFLWLSPFGDVSDLCGNFGSKVRSLMRLSPATF